MKVGGEKPWKVAVMVALMVIAAWVLVSAFAPTEPPVAATSNAGSAAANPGQAQAQQPTRRRARSADARTPTVRFPQTLDPTLRLDVLESVEKLEYSGRGRNIFSSQAEPPPRTEVTRNTAPPPVAVNPQPVTPTQPTGPPPPPPINLKFFGMASRPGQPKKVFLSSGDDIFMGGEGDIINRRYRIVRIGANTVEIEDVLSNQRQTIPMSQG